MSHYQNILLVYPIVPGNTFWSYSHALNFINKKSAMPPLGLVTIAALFPESYQLKLVDLNIEPLTDEAISWADAVFVSAMIVQKESMEDIVRRCRDFNKTIVAGGPYVTNNYEQIEGVDHLLRGEVDETLCDFLNDLENDTAGRLYDMPAHPDISRLPTPRFDLLEMSAYGSMMVQYSRGCPFHCEFCDIWTVYGNKPRLKAAESLIAELDALYDLGWEGAVFVVDDNFIGNKRRVKAELLPAMEAWQAEHGRPFHFFTEASINMADDTELLSGMRKAGFNEVFIGIETPDPEGLAETGKTQNLKSDMGTAIQTIQTHGIEVLAGFILGFDTDKSDIFDRQIDFIQKNALPKAMIGLLNALPGTRLYERLTSEGRMLSASLGNNTHSMTTNFQTVMDPDTLREGYKKILAHIYDYRMKNYFARCTQFLDTIAYRNYFQRKVRAGELKIFLKSLFRQPFTPYGLQYIKFLTRNLLKNSDLFAMAVTFSIHGHHFHIITQQTLKKEKIAFQFDKKYQQFNELINQYSAAMLNNSRPSLVYLNKLWKTRIKYLKQMQHMINKLNGDFRTDLSRKYYEISRQMRDLLAGFEARALLVDDSPKNNTAG
ncbi:MAG: B12-binding domain-containing radical SAM protein [Thermodesulfobacteriota bacterium]